MEAAESTEGQAPADPPFRGVVAQIRVATGIYHLFGSASAEHYWPVGSHDARVQAVIAVSEALKEYLARHAPDAITEAMDRTCAELRQPVDKFVASAARRVLERSEW